MKWNFSPLFYFRKLKSMLHWFIIFEFKLWSGVQSNFSIPPKLLKRPGTSDVIRCVSFDCFTLSQCISYKASTHWAVFLAVLFSGKCPQMMNYPVTHHRRVILSHCSQRWKGKAVWIRSFSAIESGRGWRRHDGGSRGRQRWYTLCDLRISIQKRRNSLKLVNYKSAMPSM